MCEEHFANECCPNNKRGCRWAVGSNMPGYMPDSDVAHFQSWKAARDCLIHDLEQAWEDLTEHDNLKAPLDAIDKARAYLMRRGRVRECQVTIGKYVYWLTRMDGK